MARNLVQCIIQNYTGPRTFDALQIPHGYLIKNVQLPHTISLQTKPLEKSIVFVAQTDDYQAFFISIVRDPIGFLEKSPTGVTGSVDDPDNVENGRSSDQFDPGEIYLESVGPNDKIAGEGSVLYLKNDGSITLRSGKFKESIVIGNVDDGQDQIVITADNGQFNSNIGLITRTQSTFRFDEDNTIEVGNFKSPVPGFGDLLEIPINSLTLEPDGEVTLGNFTLLGIKKAELNMSSLGNMTLATFSSLGSEINKLEMTPLGTTTLDANIINLNNGVRPAARQEDLTIITSSTDATYLSYLTLLDSFMSTIFAIFNAHTHGGVTGGSGSTFIPSSLLITPPPTSPSTITGKINLVTNSSASVLIGD